MFAAPAPTKQDSVGDGFGAAPRRASVKAIISDIHSNLEALQAVLKDIEQQGVTEIYCLGDIVGYGPNPRECVDLVMQCKIVLLGNHDQGAMFDPDGFNRPRRTRHLLDARTAGIASAEGRQAKERRWEFLAERPRSVRESGLLFVHGSARNPLNEYVFPEDIYNQRKMERIFALVEKYCFQGHTHVPGIFTEQVAETCTSFTAPKRSNISIGSTAARRCATSAPSANRATATGAACYILLDDGDAAVIHYRRVEYDIETTIKKIYAIPELDNFLGDRLRDGR